MPAAPVAIRCVVTRDSVAMGDDATAPNRRDYDIAVAADDAAPLLTCLRAIVLDYGYLPSVFGGSTWLASVDGVCAAIAVRRADGSRRDLIPLPGAPPRAERLGPMGIHFAYWLNVDPERLLRQLAAGERMERVYAEDAPWMA